MKAQLSLLAVVALILHASWISPLTQEKSVSGLSVNKSTPPTPNFSFFRTHRQGSGITSTWGLDQNTGVSGFVLQRTYEDPTDPYSTWDDITALPCGGARSYKHSDMNVSPGFISYRVIAYMQGGGSMSSVISTERVVGH